MPLSNVHVTTCLIYKELVRNSCSATDMLNASLGLLPIIQNMTYGGRDLESFEAIENLKDQTGKGWVEVSIGGMCYRYALFSSSDFGRV